MLRVYGVDEPFLSRACPETQELNRPMEQKFPLPPRLPQWQAGTERAAVPSDALVTWLMPQRAKAAWKEGPTLLYSRPGSHPGLPQAGITGGSLPESSISPVAQTGQPAPDKTLTGDGPFYQDRLGLRYAQEGQPEEAQSAFQELAQNRDPLWQRLAKVRLADLELARLQAEPAP